MLIKLKALSIRQPWAWLIVNGIKDVENRSWEREPQGWIAIHASKNFDEASYQQLVQTRCIASLQNADLPKPDEFEYGKIIGLAKHTANIVPGATDQSPWHAYGSHGWVLENAYAIEPIAWRGALGLFEVGIPQNVIRHETSVKAGF